MAYRLIRFGPNEDVVLDKQCDAPNQLGDNEIWAQETGGTAWLLASEGWYILRSMEEKVGGWCTWIAKPKDRPFPKYIQMLTLTGAI